MSVRGQIIFWSIVVILIFASVPLITTYLFPKDQCAIALSKGKGTCCYGSGQCRRCFDVSPHPIRSSNGTMIESDPGREQHNALVEALICECNNYRNETNDKEIETLFKILTGKKEDAKTICLSESMLLVKYNY